MYRKKEKYKAFPKKAYSFWVNAGDGDWETSEVMAVSANEAVLEAAQWIKDNYPEHVGLEAYVCGKYEMIEFPIDWEELKDSLR